MHAQGHPKPACVQDPLLRLSATGLRAATPLPNLPLPNLPALPQAVQINALKGVLSPQDHVRISGAAVDFTLKLSGIARGGQVRGLDACCDELRGEADLEVARACSLVGAPTLRARGLCLDARVAAAKFITLVTHDPDAEFRTR